MLLTYKSFLSIIFCFIILIPLIPKISIAKGIYINPIEIILMLFTIVSLFLFRKNIFFHRIQKALLFLFLVEIFFTLISFINSFYLSGLLKLIKYSIYISVFYIGYRFLNYGNLRTIVFVGNIAMLMNVIFYLYNIYNYGFSIWNTKALSSGFVNKYIDFSTMSLSTIPSGAHAIWGDYCVFIFAISLALFYIKKISFKALLITSLLSLVNLSIGVARTSFLTFSLFLSLIFIYHFAITGKVNKKLLYLSIISGLVILSLTIYFYDSLPLIKKFIYTVNSLMSTGEESNLVARYQVWILSLYDVFYNPLHIFIGSGYNKEEFLSRINEANIYFNFSRYPSVPESFYVESLVYGGILGLISLVWFSFLAIYYSLTQNNIISKYFAFFFISEVVVNLISGAIMRSDLVLFHIMLLLGFIARMKDEKKYFASNCQGRLGRWSSTY